MKAKKIAALITASIVTLSLVSCGGTNLSNDNAIYNEGTYSQTVKGHNGEVTVKVKISDSKIEEISVEDHVETAGLGDKAFETLIPEIIKTQSTSIDTVSGATVSSKALFSAVEQAIIEASKEKAEITNEFKPGEYSATVTGHNGDLNVKMSFSETEILSIDVDHVESNGIGTSAIEIIKNEVLDNQSLNIDSISGATVTSNAFIAAINECVQQTGVTISTLTSKPISIEEKQDTAIEKTSDVIVIGGGGAGLAAATEAIENGAKVIIIDKNEYIGGNTARAGGTLNAPDPERQSAIGVEDSVELFFENTMAAGDYKSDESLVQVLAENALAARQWLSDHGAQWTEKVYQTIGGLWPRSMDEKNKVAYNAFIEPLVKTVENKGGEVIVNCKATELIVENNTVIGVKAIDTKNDQEYIFNANNGVIITTGGYSANEDMVMEYNGISGLPTSNAPSSTGDGIVLANAIGADLEGMEDIQIHPHGNPTTGGLQSHFAGVIKNSIYVNQEGNRFVEESGRRDVISNATIEQTGQVMYSIYDSQGGFYEGVTELKDLDNLLAKGYIYKADTLEDLANQVGIDVEGLSATVERYNELVRSGKDTDFEKDELDLEIGTAPYYCVPLSPTVHHTMGGIKINTDAEVINTDGNVINGLYAAGEVTGGIHGSNRIGGNALTDCVVFGRIAGANAANNKNN